MLRDNLVGLIEQMASQRREMMSRAACSALVLVLDSCTRYRYVHRDSSSSCRRAARSSRTASPYSSQLLEVPQARPVFCKYVLQCAVIQDNSVTKCLGLRFSFSRCFSRLASLSIPPYLAFQR